ERDPAAGERDSREGGRKTAEEACARAEPEPCGVPGIEEQAAVQRPLERRGVGITRCLGQQAHRAEDLGAEAQAILQERQIDREPVRELRADREIGQPGVRGYGGAGIERDEEFLEIELSGELDIAPGAAVARERALIAGRQKER